MKLFLASIFITLLGIVIAAESPRRLIFTFPEGTPDHVYDDAKAAVVEANGVISHEFNIFRGFVATTTNKAINSVKALSSDYAPEIEEDGTVAINGGH